MKKYLTKKEAINLFNEFIADKIARKDKIARRIAWNEYTDMLYKDGVISLRQYNSWTQPF